MKAKKRAARWLIATACIVFIIGSGKPIFSEQLKGEITLWSGSGVIRHHFQNCALPLFEKEYPNVKVKTSGFPYGQYNIKMITAMSAGLSDPDVMVVHAEFADPFISVGGVVDLTDHVEPIKYDYPASLWPIVTRDGRIYGIPEEIDFVTFFYRKDIFDKYGIAVPLTLDEYFRTGEKLKEQEIYINNIDTIGGTTAWNFRDYLSQLGGNYFDSEGSVILDTEKGRGVEAAKIMNKMVKAGISFTAEQVKPQLVSALNEGKVAAWWFENWGVRQLQAAISPQSKGFGNWRMTTAPTLEKDGAHTASTVSMWYFINKNSDNKELALLFADFYLHSLEAQSTSLSDVCLANGYYPALNKLAYEGSTSPWPVVGGQQIGQQGARILLEPGLHFLNYPSGFKELERLTAEQLTAMFAGKVTPEQAIHNAVEKWKKK